MSICQFSNVNKSAVLMLLDAFNNAHYGSADTFKLPFPSNVY